jgi:hypothetical protein
MRIACRKYVLPSFTRRCDLPKHNGRKPLVNFRLAGPTALEPATSGVVPVPAGEPATLFVVAEEGPFAMMRVPRDDAKCRLQVHLPTSTSSLLIRAQTTDGKTMPPFSLLMRYNGELVPTEVAEELGEIQGLRRDGAGQRGAPAKHPQRQLRVLALPLASGGGVDRGRRLDVPRPDSGECADGRKQDRREVRQPERAALTLVQSPGTVFPMNTTKSSYFPNNSPMWKAETVLHDNV